MAVLLENILERIDKIEQRLNISSNHTVVADQVVKDRSIQAQGKLRRSEIHSSIDTFWKISI